jgi:DNA-binding IclR family transcriptional regulator
MPEHRVTPREQAINDILEHASRRQRFKLGDVTDLDNSNSATYQRAATSLEELDWLQRDSDGGKVWKRGPKLRDLMRGVPV